MNAETTIHPKLQHLGLTTANLHPMIDWYQKVLGMTIVNRTELPAAAQHRAPFSAMAFVSNEEVHHRIALFEVPGLEIDAQKSRHSRMQHLAFEYENIDDLLGTYARLKNMGIVPVMAADEGAGTAFYYVDPDQNNIELNVNNFANEWTATEYMKNSAGFRRAQIDPDKMIAARKAGSSPWELRERALAGEFAPAKPYDMRQQF